MVSRNLEDIEPAAGELAQTEPSQAEQAAELRELDKVSDAAWARPRTTKIAPGPDARKLNSLEGEDLKPLRLFQQRLYDRYGLELQFTEETGELVQGVPEQHFEPVPIPNAAPGAQILPTGIRITAYQPGHSEEEAVEPEAAPAAPARKFWSLGHRPQPRQEPATRLVHYSSMDIPGKFIHQGFLLAGNAVGLNFEEVKALHTHGIVGGDERVLRSEGNQGLWLEREVLEKLAKAMTRNDHGDGVLTNLNVSRAVDAFAAALNLRAKPAPTP